MSLGVIGECVCFVGSDHHFEGRASLAKVECLFVEEDLGRAAERAVADAELGSQACAVVCAPAELVHVCLESLAGAGQGEVLEGQLPRRKDEAVLGDVQRV